VVFGEWLCGESIQTVGRSRERAAEYAESALVIAEIAPMEELFSDAPGRFLLGAHRERAASVNKFVWADEAFEQCAALWKAGATGDPDGLLDAGRVLGLEASLRRDQRRYPEALRLLHEALRVATKEGASRI